MSTVPDRSGPDRSSGAPTRRRRWRPRHALTAALASALVAGLAPIALSPAPASASPPAVRTAVPEIAGRYLSAPPPLPGSTPDGAAPRAHADDREQAPTKGLVTGRVLTPDGKPLAGALVQGIRFNDLGPGINYFSEAPVLARTGTDGRFRLKQLQTGYLIRVCDAERGAEQCGSDAAPDRWAPTYAGPDGVGDSWVTQTRLYTPKAPTRAVGDVRMRPYAELRGTFTGGAGQTVRLLRGNGTEAAKARVDDQGRYRFRVVPGRYRVEADRHEGLRTVATVPGFRSAWLTLRASAATRLDFRTSPAAVVAGLVTEGGTPLPEQLVVITDDRNRWAAGAVTDENGRYVVESLRPGRYTVQLSSAYSGYTPVSTSVTLRTGAPARADLEPIRGAVLVIGVADPDGYTAFDAEVRDRNGLVVKSWQGDPGGAVEFSGLRAGRYEVYVRRAVQDAWGSERQTAFPWAQRSVVLTRDQTAQLGAIALDRPTLNLTGTLPQGAQVKITALPFDAFLREDYLSGPRLTAMALNWTEPADARGGYLSRGLVPGRYAVQVTTSLLNPDVGGSTYGGNVAATHHVLTVGSTGRRADFTAPVGAVLTGKLRYAGTDRPLIAPVGYRADDPGFEVSLFPTVSGAQEYGKGFRVDRLHSGRTSGALLDVIGLREASEGDEVLVPDELLDSAPIAEQRTPYWLTSPTRTAQVRAGQVTDLGTVPVSIRR